MVGFGDAPRVQDRPVLLIGNGPSAWGVDAATIGGWMRAEPSLVVAACNKAALDLPCHYAFAVDREMLWHWFEGNAHLGRCLCVPRDRVQSWVMAGKELPRGLEDGKNLLMICDAPSAISTGCAAFEALVNGRPSVIGLLGFDGSLDNRNRYTGTACYRQEPAESIIFEKWERIMLNLAHQLASMGTKTRYFLGLEHERPHPLDELPARRVRPAQMGAVLSLLSRVPDSVLCQ